MPDDGSILDWLVELVPGSAAVVAIGDCAVFGAIPAAVSDVNGAAAAQGVADKICPGKRSSTSPAAPLTRIGCRVP